MRKLWASAKMVKNPVFDERGNVLVYVLIAVALFGALSFTLSRRAHNAGANEIEDVRLDLYTTDLVNYSLQARSVIDQMMITGTGLGDLDFTRPGESGFEVAPHIHKVFHPHGGGLSAGHLPTDITLDRESEAAGWYFTSSINVEWTNSSAHDLILTAYQINKALCERINKKITGHSDIPALSGQVKDYFIDSEANRPLDISACEDCEGYSSMCVSNNNRDSFGFYTVLVGQ
ncbi:MAG: hypothetical protein ACLFP8_02850 [Alphaproteobacteria bacterium]